MAIVYPMEQQAGSPSSKVMASFRILLGLIIFGKGLYFISHNDAILQMLGNSKIEFLSFMLTHYVAMAHLVGGLMIAFGLLTRVAILFQIPILIGAIIFVHMKTGFFSIHSELALSIVVLAMLGYYLYHGAGIWSLDAHLKKDKHL